MPLHFTLSFRTISFCFVQRNTNLRWEKHVLLIYSRNFICCWQYHMLWILWNQALLFASYFVFKESIYLYILNTAKPYQKQQFHLHQEIEAASLEILFRGVINLEYGCYLFLPLHNLGTQKTARRIALKFCTGTLTNCHICVLLVHINLCYKFSSW